MAFILNPEDENPLWRQYMDELINLDIQERTNKWCKKDVSIRGSFKTTTATPYSQDEFLEMLELDEEFNKRWGRLRSEVRQEKIEEILDQRKQSN